MKKIILLLFCMSIHMYSFAADWSKVIKAISYVESKHNPKAKNGIYVGCLQIGPVMVKECNDILRKQNNPKRFTLNDRYNKDKSYEMFILFQSKYNPSGNIEKAIRMWNGGPKYSVGKTNGYYKKVMKALNK